ncbi:hypothetical protein SPI_00670 [Niveomyces insectorum RCEF 264]|uniref:Uncharacterized protein n=1 Tax=Niveomyces insectorum RCEF 264 TaxID=1081102 RepID=A0A168AAE1_9HYPO|nr:hypothetical protein SPI_00670 [Niveomyces insectorum RCEF 264]
MRILLTLITALSAISFSLADPEQRRRYAPLSTSNHDDEVENNNSNTHVLYKRDTSLCQQTYGPGSIECGNAAATMCYNPGLGQCYYVNFRVNECQHRHLKQNEDLPTCATNAGFQLPAAALVALASSSAAASSANVSSTATATATTAAIPTEGNASSPPGTPYVQISAVARKEQRTLVWTSLGIVIVGVIMATF